MKLAKAINTITLHLKDPGYNMSQDWKDTLLLALEALKWRRRIEKAVLPDKYTPLPGETSE